MYFMFQNAPHRPGTPSPFNNACLILLGLFPLFVMFIITSITMQRERASGTLERILTTPLRRLDLLVAYGTAFSIAAAAQATLACVVSFWLLGFDTAGSPVWVFVIAIINAVLGVGLGLLCSAFARTEFQAVQFIPLVMVPQLLLAGIIVPRDADATLAAVDQQRAAGQLRAGGAAAGGRAPGTDRTSRCATSSWCWVSRWRRCAWPRRRCGDGRRRRVAADQQRRRKRPGPPAPGTLRHPRPHSGQRARVVRPQRDSTRLDTRGGRRGRRRLGVGASLLRHQGAAVRRGRSTFRSTRWPVIGPLREVPVEELGYRLPSMLLPLWDSEMGAGFIATLRSILAGDEVNLFRSFLAGRDQPSKSGPASTIRREAAPSASSSSRPSWWAW